MGRKRNTGEKPEKKTAIKVAPIPRKHAGKITEPWAIMEKLIAECPHFEALKVAKVKLWWQKDWKADVDGIAIGAQVCKASEIDRNLAEESAGETVDLFIKLPKEQWPNLDETEKRHRLFHELLHIRPALNSEGKQKRDAKDRLLWRLRKHPITAFHEEITEFGIERVIGHNESIVDTIRTTDRPMEKIFQQSDQAEKKGEGETAPDAKAPAAAAADGEKPAGSWRSRRIDKSGLFTDKQADALEAAGLRTLGGLQELMLAERLYWAKNLKINGRFKQDIEDRLNDFLAQQSASEVS